MKPSQSELWATLIESIEIDGFDYALIDYSDWRQIEDEKFQNLRTKFVSARKELTEYILHMQQEQGIPGELYL